jgi:hypothetical protein
VARKKLGTSGIECGCVLFLSLVPYFIFFVSFPSFLPFESQEHSRRCISTGDRFLVGAGIFLFASVQNCSVDSSGSGQGPVAGSCEHGNEHFASIKGREFLD